MFRTDLLSIIRSLNTVYTTTGTCHASYVDCLLARSGPEVLTSLTDSHDARSCECQIAIDTCRHFSPTLILATVRYFKASARSYQHTQHHVPKTETNLLAYTF